ncbi:MAG: response regulator [Oceanisphaera sp.]|uniref:hybrid sensor histidine kinase/response regulator n=1 Tax=Oceanisphaera sp. TaxID=1929979 RepID=UPI003C751348
MTMVAKRLKPFARGRALLMYGLLLSPLLLAYTASQYWLHRYYNALELQIAPVVSALENLQHEVIISNENSKQLNSKVVALSLATSGFIDFIQQAGSPLTGSDNLIDLLEQYQKNIHMLQDADMRSRYALNAFADKVQALPASPYSDQNRVLLQRSQQYLNVTNPILLYTLDEDAGRLQQEMGDNQQDPRYFFQLYRQSLEQLVQLRYELLADDNSALLTYSKAWRQQVDGSWQKTMLMLFLMLLLGFSLALVMLMLRNRQLRETSQAALELTQSKTDFLANMSHEIRTPMNAIIGFASLLQQTPLVMQQQQYLKKIKNSSDNLLLLINDILDLTKVEAGKLELEDIEFDLNEQLERLSGLFSDMSEHKQLEVIIIKDPAVPSNLRGDPLRLGQVLVNLVNNAVKFTERGEVVLAVSISNDPGPQLCFVITDTGIGILPEKLEGLFHSFTQVDASTTRKYGGSGLGLSITQHLVKLMQGTISVISQPGQGSCFSVNLPLQAATTVRSEISPRFKGRKVLLVDDNSLVVEVLGQLLRQQKMVVYSAPDILGAKEMLLKLGSELDVMLIDYRLGQDSGLDLARFVQQQPHLSHIKLALTSAFGQDRLAAQMRKLGLTYYLPKPVTEYSLKHCLQQLLECGSVEQEASPGANLLDLSYYRNQLRGKKILLAEDNRMNQQLIVEFLKQVNVAVTLADNGRQAVELMITHSFDAILMDLQMPILDGIEATRQIRKFSTNHNIPIIALTASAMRGDREASLAAGMNNYVTKPVNRFDLYQALTQVLSPSASALSPTPATPSLSSTHSLEAALLQSKLQSKLKNKLNDQREFIDQHQDVGWLLQALVAAQDWSQAQQLMNALAEKAKACDLLLLLEPIHNVRLSLEREQRPSVEQISALTHQLAEIKRMQAEL